jgi:hypothetical protein
MTWHGHIPDGVWSCPLAGRRCGRLSGRVVLCGREACAPWGIADLLILAHDIDVLTAAMRTQDRFETRIGPIDQI